jgi:type I restriction-modification system DNA methylase subunit
MTICIRLLSMDEELTEKTLLQTFNRGLHDLREVFHKTGRLDDSNAKLDEVAKLLYLEIATAYEPKAKIPSLSSMLNRKDGGRGIVADINNALEQAAQLRVFRNSDGESILGSHPRLNLADSEGDLAIRLATLISETFNGHLRSPEGPKTFELLNEAFGHFVRDNFRNNIEDAQYMTPPEVVDFMCELGLEVADRILQDNKRLVVCDPSCGVASFLAQFYRCWRQPHLKKKQDLMLFGQDKVDRMARLGKLNLLLFGSTGANVARGNSLLPGSELDDYMGACDLVLTNPPFGARFHTTELAMHSLKFFSGLHDFIQSTNGYVDSELLFIDRYMSLLRPGGTALVVVPDAVISAKGLPEVLREYVAKNCSIVSITELPSVTFAQAGTRTKTCVLHFRKQPPVATNRVFFGSAKALGFEVASRKGVNYKRNEGTNELPGILTAYRSIKGKHGRNEDFTIHSEDPSCVSVPYSKLMTEAWTPSHHSAVRYTTLAALGVKSTDDGSELVRLSDMVILPPRKMNHDSSQPEARCISVLHVGDFGSLNVRELLNYSPKFPGRPCSPGDILFSKINPRIPRALVVPDLGFPLTCSTEFEVMRAKAPYSSYEVMLLLLSSTAQSQIQSLTSGTSSSHNRIKTEQLMSIMFSIPKGKKKADFSKLADEFKSAHLSMMKAGVAMHSSWKEANLLQVA